MNNVFFDKSFGISSISGADEAGRGSLIGPVISAVVIPKYNMIIDDVDDSKKLSPKKRNDLFNKIISHYEYSISEATCEEIEEYNIYNASIVAIERAILNLKYQTDIILVDGNMKFSNQKIKSIISGDSKSYAIACASIVAKCYRDALVTKMCNIYPQYNWDKNFGYGTKKHFDAIKKYGVTEFHRKSFLNKFYSRS